MMSTHPPAHPNRAPPSPESSELSHGGATPSKPLPPFDLQPLMGDFVDDRILAGSKLDDEYLVQDALAADADVNHKDGLVGRTAPVTLY